MRLWWAIDNFKCCITCIYAWLCLICGSIVWRYSRLLLHILCVKPASSVPQRQYETRSADTLFDFSWSHMQTEICLVPFHSTATLCPPSFMWQQNNQHIYPLPASLPRRTSPVQLHCCGWWPTNPWLYILEGEQLRSERNMFSVTLPSKRYGSMWSFHCAVAWITKQLLLLYSNC